uniref:G-protein coupled receptors family 1 profile domain-containing protein n=1 Tax=Anabas testudineus TaxID=64144 RepID=A0A7N6FM58_ANATE
MFQVDENYTRITEFVIVGFPSLQPEYFQLVAWFFFLFYVTTVVGNLLLVMVFAWEHSLQKPMYIIMVSLALSDIGKYGSVFPLPCAFFSQDLVYFVLHCFHEKCLS